MLAVGYRTPCTASAGAATAHYAVAVALVLGLNATAADGDGGWRHDDREGDARYRGATSLRARSWAPKRRAKRWARHSTGTFSPRSLAADPRQKRGGGPPAFFSHELPRSPASSRRFQIARFHKVVASIDGCLSQHCSFLLPLRGAAQRGRPSLRGALGPRHLAGRAVARRLRFGEASLGDSNDQVPRRWREGAEPGGGGLCCLPALRGVGPSAP